MDDNPYWDGSQIELRQPISHWLIKSPEDGEPEWRIIQVDGKSVLEHIPRPGEGPQIGDIEREGDHKGEIYGGIWSKEYGGDDKPIWFSAASRPMDHFKAAAWATEQGSSLPTRSQGEYLQTIKDHGALKDLFNRNLISPENYIWLAEPVANDTGSFWSQKVFGGLTAGEQFSSHELNEYSVLCVHR